MLRNTLLWVVLDAARRHRVGPGLRRAGRQGPVRGVAKALIFLPMAISFVGASDHLEVRLRLPAGESSQQIGLLNQILVWLGGDP